MSCQQVTEWFSTFMLWKGYKHKEIAEMLGIDTNTSKSQYSRAKAVIRDKLEKLGKLKSSYSEND